MFLHLTYMWISQFPNCGQRRGGGVDPRFHALHGVVPANSFNPFLLSMHSMGLCLLIRLTHYILQGVTNLPPCVKYLLDLLDSEAERLQISDPEILHTWKNNALPLRYWISIIKSPDVVFDVRKNNNIDSCLSVIAQTFLDATSFEDMTIDKNSQSSRLLYCKEIPRYKQHVREFYGEVQTCPPVSESEIEAAFNRNHEKTGMKKETALYQLFCYASRFSEEIRDSLCDKGYKQLAEQFMNISDNNTDV